VRTLFAKFLLWFWLGLALLLGAEILLETHSLNEGLAVHFSHVARPIELYADLARAVFVMRGEPGLDSLTRALDREADIETFVVDSVTATTGRDAASKTALAALRGGHSVVVETPAGFFVGSPLVRQAGVLDALVLHPRHGNERRGLLPPDLAERALAMLVLGGIGCWLLARYIAAPVSRLRQATQRIAAGDLTARVDVKQRRRRDELEDLGRDFDRMAERLEALVGAQRRLLSDISHELRSPLARMNVALALMRQQITGDPDGMMARLELEASRLNQLIGDVLTLSRAESGEPVPASQRVDLGALATDVANDARFEAAPQSKEVRLTCRGDVAAMGAPELLRSAVDNVVRNAIRHTRNGTAVEIVVEHRAEAGVRAAVIEVRDHGPGLPADQLERVFEPFYRFEGSPGPPSGTGLGLAIARRVLARHGGSIDAHTADGAGLVITLRLPAV